MKHFLAIATLLVATATQAAPTLGFTGDYDVSLWQTDFTSPCVGCVTVATASTLDLYGADDTKEAFDQFTDRSITVAQDATISFDWSYSTDDLFGPFFDPFGIIMTGSQPLFTQLSDGSGGSSQSGSFSIIVQAGDLFGFRVWSLDSLGGQATATINNFRVDTVPEPGTLWLLGIGMLGAVAARRRRVAA